MLLRVVYRGARTAQRSSGKPPAVIAGDTGIHPRSAPPGKTCHCHSSQAPVELGRGGGVTPGDCMEGTGRETAHTLVAEYS